MVFTPIKRSLRLRTKKLFDFSTVPAYLNYNRRPLGFDIINIIYEELVDLNFRKIR